MPILPAEPALYPSDLWDHIAPGGDDGPSRWWCLYTRPRQEKATARYLLAHQVPYYLPLVVHESRTPGGRKIRSIVPLFPGYLFLYGDKRQRVEGLKGNTLVDVLEVPDQVGLERDLRQIHRLLSSGLPVVPELSHPVGTNVRIVTGPFLGMVGVVVRRDNSDRFVAVVQLLGRGAAVALQDWQVERVGEEPAC
jgi:transcription antitermination factor NusG